MSYWLKESVNLRLTLLEAGWLEVVLHCKAKEPNPTAAVVPGENGRAKKRVVLADHLRKKLVAAVLNSRVQDRDPAIPGSRR